MIGEAAARERKIEAGDHKVAVFDAVAEGPTLIVVGSIHGNEPAGMHALENVSRALKPISGRLRGRAYFLAGNTRALARDVRFINCDLNRHWTKENLAFNGQGKAAEDLELGELLAIFENVLQTASDEVFVLDLHTTSAGGATFATVGDTLRNRHFAQMFPLTILLGIEEQLTGTMLEHLNNRGAVTLGFEGGQHASAEAVENHSALIWLALVNSCLLEPADVPDLEDQRSLLRASTRQARLLEVRYRESITAEDDFHMNPGFSNFDPILRGQIIASNKYGPIRAAESGLILMPLYQRLGEDGFFIGREISPFWLWLSKVLRKFGAANLMPWLPGVQWDPTNKDSLVVDTRVARFFPLQIFHLLGFRRLRWEDQWLIVSRRRFDSVSPFTSGNGKDHG